MPTTTSGRWSLGLIAAMVLLFAIGTVSTTLVHPLAPAGTTILEDLALRPVLALSMLAGMACGSATWITGLSAIIRERERAPVVYIATIIGAFLTVLLLGEVLVPH